MNLENDTKVFVSGCDIDGIPRGKIMNKHKFLSSDSTGFGFCNVIFGWDLHDAVYEPQTPLMKQDSGFSDILAKIDYGSYRRCPLTQIPHFLVEFHNPHTKQPLPFCPRSLLKRIISSNNSVIPLTGVEFEFFNFKETPDSLHKKKGLGLEPMTTGMFGYSSIRPAMYQEYFDDIFDKSREFGIPLEIIHTETGPGVYEAAIEYAESLELADRAHLFKMLVKKLGLKYGLIPCFMAKPYENQPGCSGHLHFSLKNFKGENLFLDEKDPQFVSSTLKSFVAGVMQGLPSIMAVLAPTINSYKRLNAAYWAPVTISYGFESRISAIRIITPPICSSNSTRIEVRVPGADHNPYLAVAAILACGYRGITQKLPLPEYQDPSNCPSLPRSLLDAVEKMDEPNSIARQVLGNEFVDHFVATRRHELRLWQTTVTTWEVNRYMETV